MIKFNSLLFCFAFISLGLKAQKRWPIDIYIDGYGYIGINNNVKLNDTAKINHSQSIYFKFVFFNAKGKSYCEIYKNNVLFEKGYFENSLDTLKCYTQAKSLNGRSISKIQVHKYFQPLKNGEWIVFENGRMRKENYSMGILSSVSK